MKTLLDDKNIQKYTSGALPHKKVITIDSVNEYLFCKKCEENPCICVMNEDKETKFNIPKNEEDKRRLLIDLENNVGVIIKEESGFFIVLKYKSK